jgi:MFS family permease
MAERSGFRSAWAVREFRALWAAEAVSQIGDQLARVALTVLVYSRTNSAALAALTLALSYTPSFIGSALFSGLADRWPRREVMIGCDLISAALVVVMALPGMPLWLVCVAMAGVAMVGGPFKAARLALLPEVLDGEAYVGALAMRSMTIQIAQVLGFAVGGAAVGLIGPRPALAVDAVTFLLSMVLVLWGVPRRPAPQNHIDRRSFWKSSLHGARLIAEVPGLRALYVLAMLAGLYITPEGLAAPWAAELRAAPQAVGLIMGAPAVGLVVGAWAFTKFVTPDQRARSTGVLAALAGLALTLCAARPGLTGVLGLLVLSGIFSAYQVQVGATFGRLTPPEGRAQVMGLLNSGVLTAQGVGVLLSGVVAEFAGVPATVALAGAVGLLAAVPTGWAWSRATAGDPAAR